MTQALAFGAAGGLAGVLSAVPTVQMAQKIVAWIYLPVLLPAFAMCVLASVVSIRAAVSVEPARVFRA